MQASVIGTIDFESAEYAFLESSSDGTSQELICQNPANMTPFSASLGWLPRVQESDIEVIQWMNDRVRCIWNYRHVGECSNYQERVGILIVLRGFRTLFL